MPTLLHWELSDQGGLMLSSSEEIASRGSIFLYVADLAAERRRLDEAGIALGSDLAGDYSTLAQVRQPDGHLITLATPPSRPFPPAQDFPPQPAPTRQRFAGWIRRGPFTTMMGTPHAGTTGRTP